MANNFTYVPYAETGFFSSLVTGYLNNQQDIRELYHYEPSRDGIAQAIKERGAFPVNREILVNTLRKQYTTLSKKEATERNIDSLLHDDTFTVCTAHQPNLLTGYLYFVYKILHTIKLADELNEQYPDKHFVPVYYMGSVGNVLEELGTFRFRGQKYVWDGNGQQGAVGRMHAKGLKPLLQELFKVFGPPGKNCDELQELLTQAYLQHKTIAEATQYLVHELFGRYGLVVINPDDAALKSLFIPVMQDELLQQSALPIIDTQIKKLAAHYKVQAHPRNINLFYLTDELRERIEKHGDKWTVINTSIQWSRQELIAELEQYPERFSPNVMLRGLFQETILPNVAFIGGGAEVAYWLQLKTLFEHYGLFYPAILLRQSVLWADDALSGLRKQLSFGVPDLFKSTDQLKREYVSTHATDEQTTAKEHDAIAAILQALKAKATNIDKTLEKSADALLAKMTHQLNALEQKMLRAEKRKMQVEMDRIERLKKALFPNNSLQERVENFTEYYLQYGSAFFDTLMQGIEPLHNRFLVIEPTGQFIS